MYSGYILVYGIKISKSAIPEKYIGEELFYDDNSAEVNNYLLDNTDIFRDDYYQLTMNVPIQFMRKCCCYNDDEIFIGMQIINNTVIYRDQVEDYDDIQEYFKEVNDKLFDAMKNFHLFKHQIDKVLELVFNINEDLRQIPKIYKFANGCEHCT